MKQPERQVLLARFWEAGLGFWGRNGGVHGWTLSLTVIAIALLNIVLQYRINVWHRAMFDALDKRDAAMVVHQTLIFFPLILISMLIGASATFGKMTLQRRWRRWLNGYVLDRW